MHFRCFDPRGRADSANSRGPVAVESHEGDESSAEVPTISARGRKMGRKREK